MLKFIKAIYFISLAYCSLIIKLVDGETGVASSRPGPGRDENMNIVGKHNAIITDLQAFEEIIKSSYGRKNEKFVLLNAVLDDDLYQKDTSLVPDIVAAESLILKDLKNILTQSADDEQNMYSVHVHDSTELKEVSKKINQMMIDETVACYVFLTSKRAWSAVEEVHDGKQHVLLSSQASKSQKLSKDKKISALAGSTNDFCPLTVSDCIAATANCSNHGSCVKKNHPRQVNRQCYFCSCTVKKWTDDHGNTSKLYGGKVDWTGPACQYQDISVQFHIIFWTSLALLVVIILSVGLLYDIGEGGAGFGVAGSGIAYRQKQE